MNDADGPVGSHHPVSLHLLDGFELRAGDSRLDVPAPARRLLAYLAVRRRPLGRAHVAGVLWPDTTDSRAKALLRTAVWRLQSVAPDTVVVTPTTIAIAPHVAIDIALMERTASALRSGDPSLDPADVEPSRLAGELLPELWDDWTVFERERLRQTSIHALELLSQRLTDGGDHGRAVLAALTAVEMEPLRETANRRLVLAHLAEGNVAEAARSYRRYAGVLKDELGIEPQASFTALLEPALISRP
jgi:DNA-binding SARP family transcriptional activator